MHFLNHAFIQKAIEIKRRALEFHPHTAPIKFEERDFFDNIYSPFIVFFLCLVLGFAIGLVDYMKFGSRLREKLFIRRRPETRDA
ncbi:hypothetical protein L5515_002792 [Caenorhabditis briggsae]|uniref:Uncharacterized protein n=1 Tax=Caenorhabditis briggsae TaxID=6238 RepID=A0AAE9E9U6_CAEBR|nr:hypothetical protein L3Y34_016711 [Caenorhabditis briggsae]UMM15331.1 hypothetical protein L5515_002792 [Caenorhabditis briggsae]